MIGQTSLSDVCGAIASHFDLDEQETLRVAAGNVMISSPSRLRNQTPGSNPQLVSLAKQVALPEDAAGDSPRSPLASTEKSTRASSSFISLSDAVEIPEGKKLPEMTVEELANALFKADNQEEKAVPFLLRYVLGEWHYGQRATRLLPGQKPQSAPKTPPETSSNEGREQHANVVADAFDVLAKESNLKHLHQMAGWVDLDDKGIWDAYVNDVIDRKVRPGDSVFEAGCGVLAFLRSVEESAGGNLVMGGNDGARKTIDLVRNELVDPSFKENFFCGMLPDSMEQVPTDSWDIVVCNSVFQYLPDKETARAAVEGMIRAARRWVIIADICDSKFADRVASRQGDLDWAKDLPEYRTYSKSWWEDMFDKDHIVSIRHVEVPHYVRRTERYVVYIEKNARVNAPSSSLEVKA